MKFNPMNLFRGDPNPTPAPQQTQQAQPTGTQNGAGAPGSNLAANKPGSNGDGANSPAAEGKAVAQPTPLDPYKDLWKDEPVANPASGEGTPSGAKTPAQPQEPNFAEMAKKIDFSRLVNPETLTKAFGGDTTAMAEVLNTVGRASFAASSRMSDTLAKTHVKTFEDRFSGELPDKFKQFQLRDSALPNPAMSHPAIRPLVDAIKDQMRVKFPDATTADLTAHAEKYISGVFGEINGGDPTKKAAEAQASHKDTVSLQENGEYDWMKYGAPAVQTSQ